MADPQPNKRTRINRPYPIHTLESALSIARTIYEVNAGLPMDRLLLAAALGTTPSSSSFRMRLSSSEKYSLTDGAYNDERISLAPLGRSAVSPSSPEELQQALLRAATAPEIFRRFYSLLAGKRLPEDIYAENVLTKDLHMRPELAGECLAMIKANGTYVGILNDSSGETLVDYDATSEGTPAPDNQEDVDTARPAESPGVGEAQGRVFLGYTRPSAPVDMLRHTLEALGIRPVEAAVALDGSAAPVSPEVSRAMKRCSAAAIFAAACDAEDDSPSSNDVADQGSLILLGAASLLYGQRVVFIHPEASEGQTSLLGVASVTCHRGRPEAAVLATLHALCKAGAIRAVVPGAVEEDKTASARSIS